MSGTEQQVRCTSDWRSDGYWRRVDSWKSLLDADGSHVLVDPTSLIDWIDDFLGPNQWAALSNFYAGSPFEIDGVVYPTGEHAFHAGKACSDSDRIRIAGASSADEAKAIGRSVEMRPDWDDFRVEHMRRVVQAKFAVGRQEAEVLQATGSALIVEGTLWNDEFWGVNLERPGRPGENMLGQLLTEQRSLIQQVRCGG
jgi:ribA/ribD-fused uncharacterized protein